MPKKETETFCPASRQEWRRWLAKNHLSAPSVWLILYKKTAAQPSIPWSEAVEEALCFGWIDSKRKPLDHEKFMQFFCPRKQKGTWSRVNKEKVLQLIEQGLMAEAGLQTIELAKQNGSWTILDEVEELKIPDDLAKEFQARPGAAPFFSALSKSVRKSILQWLVLARRPETRQNRILEIAELAARGLKPKQFR